MRNGLYETVKVVEGENFVMIEDTGNLNDQELRSLASHMVKNIQFQRVKKLTILVPPKFSAETKEFLKKLHFIPQDEVYFVTCNLMNYPKVNQPFKIKSLREIGEAAFQEIWRQSMIGSLNASPSINMEDQMQNVKKELGPSYVDTCLAAFEGGKPIGVVMPHIEPGTKDEGRIFYFGLIPEQRGKKKSVKLYKQGLSLLKYQFKASYSLGSTSVNNGPMLKVFESCGCKVTGKLGVYKYIRN
ncbi:hypothetical protein SAMN05192559_101726 [Halobacillus karajensis]|uniref:N-acetyltransferase domain-containing protein n=1 Tax=Halobacillus karajensis TaxID=195088 RepID=A0A024P3Q3_9BACI|nr:GNAT family N-acetyltransferase [Halobacillus karajensis]CDQ18659.1 hypothetical protein BN982_00936 [Halobacillus karajensis]CDQ23269.1 hypothetical protein BN983_01492 [Halobacillus karajensis]CDQ26751.1 hypothetical protein BN981_00972 [Halobacillus karajensis]SEH48514.1 hypothetical protein SAMN05192559_101726 [Halobacillus karajensis]